MSEIASSQRKYSRFIEPSPSHIVFSSRVLFVTGSQQQQCKDQFSTDAISWAKVFTTKTEEYEIY